MPGTVIVTEYLRWNFHGISNIFPAFQSFHKIILDSLMDSMIVFFYKLGDMIKPSKIISWVLAFLFR